MGGLGKGSAKLILFGEHAAVYGHPVIGLALPQSLTARFSGERLAAWDLDAILDSDRDRVLAVIERLEEILPGLTGAGRCSVRIESNVPRGAGFGSSAALCVALALAALEHAGGPAKASARAATAQEADACDAWGLAHDAERLFHGTPSGVDTGLSILGGLLAFRPRPPGLPVYEKLPAAPVWLVSGAVPRDDACGALISGLGERLRAGDRVVRSAIETLGKIALRARDTFAAGGRATPVGILADEAMEELGGMGLSTPGLDTLLAAGKRAGALGGKLSGAGGGGAFYLVADSARSAGDIAEAVRGEAARAGIDLTAPLRLVDLQDQRTVA